jgi:O-acetyl-ADP-ribose deacetylase (regulator of RNase III)
MTTIEIVRGDITLQDVDAIVNAANTSLLGGGGVDGAIHRAAGPELLAECRTLSGCPTGEARVTKGYNLPARFVLHTVGPVWQDGTKGEAALLASCYNNSLRCAVECGCQTVAFPAISCGVYGYPLAQAAAVAVAAVDDFVEKNGAPGLVRWVMFDAAAFQAWVQERNKRSAS